MTRKTEFMNADLYFVILKVVKKMKNNNFFEKKNIFLSQQNFADALVI